MTVEQQFHDQNDHLFVVAEGERTAEGLQQAHEQLADYCRANSTTHVLVDARKVRGALGTMDLYELASGLQPIRDAGVERLAIVMNADEIDGFAENVAVNRGYPIRMFSKVDTARAWLRE